MDPAKPNDIDDKFQLPGRFKGLSLSFWEDYLDLVNTYNPTDLGQGFPDLPVPEHITTALQEIGKQPNTILHQYTRGHGHPRLIIALSKLYSRLIGRSINPENEILVTLGASGALFLTIMGHIEYGDEVIIIEPFFDCFEPMVRISGGVPIFIPLRPKSLFIQSSSDWCLNEEELTKSFNLKTKAIILNTPNNPLGKVYTEEELLLIAKLCNKWNVICISDEVYEWLVYKPKTHIRIATLPGMWERTITIGSAGKTFGVTGWRIGWTYGSKIMMENLRISHQNTTHSCSTLLQEALAIGLEMELQRLSQKDCTFTSLLCVLEDKKNFMIQLLNELGLNPIVPEGGYYILADCSSLASNIDLSSENDTYLDVRFTKWVAKHVGVQFLPSSVFYSEKHKLQSEHLIRVCFVKEDENLRAAAKKLRLFKSNLYNKK